MIVLQLTDYQRGVALRHASRLELEPPVPERLGFASELVDFAHDLNLEVFLLRLEVRFELPEFRGQVLPLRIQ